MTQYERAHRRLINNMLCRGSLQQVTIGATATAQIGLMANEVHANLEMPENWGFISSPPVGSELIVAFFGGNRDHGTILKAFDKNTAPQTLEPGESMMYNAVSGTKVLLDKDGQITITPGGTTGSYITFDASGVLKFQVEEFWLNGTRIV